MGSYSRAFLRLTLPQHNFHNESHSRPDVPGGQPRQPRQLCSTVWIRKVWLWKSRRRKQFQTIPKLSRRKLSAEQPECQLQQRIRWKWKRIWRRPGKQLWAQAELLQGQLPAEQPEHQLQQPIVWKVNDASISPPIVGQIV